MIVQCPDCKRRFDDEFRTWVCPHKAFAANNGDNTFTVHEDAYLEAESPDGPVTADDCGNTNRKESPSH